MTFCGILRQWKWSGHNHFSLSIKRYEFDGCKNVSDKNGRAFSLVFLFFFFLNECNVSFSRTFDALVITSSNVRTARAITWPINRAERRRAPTSLSLLTVGTPGGFHIIAIIHCCYIIVIIERSIVFLSYLLLPLLIKLQVIHTITYVRACMRIYVYEEQMRSR